MGWKMLIKDENIFKRQDSKKITSRSIKEKLFVLYRSPARAATPGKVLGWGVAK